MKKIHTLLIAGTCAMFGANAPALAMTATDHSKMGGTKMADAGADAMSDGEVRKVDKEQGKITLKHGPIRSLDMPGMTMVFTVKDKALLETVKRGDKVKFRAAEENGQYTVIEMKPAN